MKKDIIVMIEQVGNIVKNIEEVEFAYLFGSYATNTYTKNSDIDVAIFLKDRANILDTYLNVHHQLEINLDQEIDIVVLNNAKNFHLVKDILTQGRVIKDSNEEKREMYEIYKMHEIVDYFALQRLINVA